MRAAEEAVEVGWRAGGKNEGRGARDVFDGRVGGERGRLDEDAKVGKLARDEEGRRPRCRPGIMGVRG